MWKSLCKLCRVFVDSAEAVVSVPLDAVRLRAFSQKKEQVSLQYQKSQDTRYHKTIQ